MLRRFLIGLLWKEGGASHKKMNCFGGQEKNN